MGHNRSIVKDATHTAFMIFMLACVLGVLASLEGCTSMSERDRPKGDFVMNIASADEAPAAQHA